MLRGLQRRLPHRVVPLSLKDDNGLTIPAVASLSLGTGRTTELQGTIHLVNFAVYVFTTVVP